MKIVFLDAATMGDASMDEIAALGEFVCYPSSTAEEARGSPPWANSSATLPPRPKRPASAPRTPTWSS